MINQVKDVMTKNTLDAIYVPGFIDCEDDGIHEFYPDMRYLYFEFGDYLIEFAQLTPFNKPAQIGMRVVDSIQYDCDLEDVMLGRTRIDEIIFKNPLVDNKVTAMSFFDIEENDSELLCDALHIKLYNGQDIFLDPGFMGINIGGLDVKQVWEENQMAGHKPKEFFLELNNK